MRLMRGMKGWQIVLPAVALDRVTKRIVTSAGELPGIPGIVRFRAAHNEGVAFSLMSGGGVGLILLTALLIAVVLVWLLTAPDEPGLLRTGLWLIAGGGLGNLWDRIALSYVIDFIELEFVRFAVFNVADICVCVGAALAALGAILSERAKKERSNGGV